ncbi:MAG TPA: hypothetical protein PKE45_08150 [Caldilineaceae bacterium]|nr:hypothetical protein [Caldilineaceae bacterium]
MYSILLRTKLHRPASPSTAIARPACLQRLQDGLTGKVTLVSAPAGFGKITVVSLWFEAVEAQAAAALRISWLALEEADNHLLRFVHYLVAAIEDKYPQSCAAVTALLHPDEQATTEILADVLADALTQLPGRLILALDDLHLVEDAAIYAFLTRLIQHMANQLHLVLITRVDPPLPLNRWRAQGHLNELRLHDLCFNLAETTTFLHANLDQRPTDAMVATLYERTEGWVVGLRLVVLALRGQTEYAEFAANIASASSRYILDYLVDDVLDQQTPSVQKFLICTAILTRFSAGLCAAVAEMDDASAQRHINDVARANLFLIELTSPDHWYRYHHQFQDMLLSRLHERYSSQAIATLHRQAATWLAAGEK